MDRNRIQTPVWLESPHPAILSTATSPYLTEQSSIPLGLSFSGCAPLVSSIFFFFLSWFKGPLVSLDSGSCPQVSTSILLTTLCCTWVLGDGLPGHPGSVALPRPHKVPTVAQGCASSQRPFTITDTMGPDCPDRLPELGSIRFPILPLPVVLRPLRAPVKKQSRLALGWGC